MAGNDMNDQGTDHKADDGNVTVIVEGQRFVFNGKLLASLSDYFDAMFFKTQMKESILREVEIQDVTANSIEVIRDFIYDKRLSFNQENIYAVTSATVMLQFRELSRYCCSYLQDITTPSNCLTVLKFSEHYSLHEVFNKAKRISLWHFHDVIMSEDFLTQPFQMVDMYLADKILNVESSGDVLFAILKWSWDAENLTWRCSSEEFRTLLSILELTEDEQQTIVDEVKLWSGYSLEECRKNLKKLSPKSVSKKGWGLPRVLAVVGGDYLYSDGKRTRPDITYWDLGSKTFKTLTNIPFKEDDSPAHNMGYRCCVVGTQLYITGGEKKKGRNQWCRDVWRYDPFEDVWDVPTELPSPRRHHAVCTDGECLYLIGGFGSYRSILCTVDVYNVKSEKWHSLPPMGHPNFSATCACDDGHIYVVKHEVQQYSKTSESWTVLTPPLPYNSNLHSIHIVKSKIILIAEYQRKLLELDVSQRNSHPKTLTTFQDASGAGCIVGDKFYIVCGSDMEESKYIECYDLDNDSTEVVTTLDVPVANHGCIALPLLPKFQLPR